MNTVSRLLRAYPSASFAVLAWLFAWSAIPFAAGGLLPHGPTIAALVMVACTEGRVGLRAWWARVVTLHGGWPAALLGPALVVTYLAVAFVVTYASGASSLHTEHLATFGSTVLVLLLLGGQWEEPGWTGYALPRALARYGDTPMGCLLASLQVGAMRAVWHAPLVYSGAIPWFDAALFTYAFQALITWLYLRTRGVVAPVLFHFASNVFGGALIVPMFVGDDRLAFQVAFVAFAWVLAIGLWARAQARPAR